MGMSLQDDIGTASPIETPNGINLMVVPREDWDRVCLAAQESETLRAEVESWKDRFRAIVSQDSPDSAGNAVLTLRAEVERLKAELSDSLTKTWRLQDDLIAALNRTTNEIEIEYRRWYTSLSCLWPDIQGLAPEVIGDRAVQLKTCLVEARASNEEWIAENGPGGWIDNMRRDLATAQRQARVLESLKGEIQKRLQLRAYGVTVECQHWLERLAALEQEQEQDKQP